MAEITSVKIKIDIDWQKIYHQLGEEFAAEFNLNFMRLVKGEIDKYTPFLTGQMVNTAKVVYMDDPAKGAKIIYPVAYSRRQYFGDNFHFTDDPHPWARSRWDEGLSEAEYQQLINRASLSIITKYLRGN